MDQTVADRHSHLSYKVGVDLGGTKIEAILLDGNLNTLARKRTPTPTEYHQIISSISDLVSDITSDIDDYTFGICTPGVISTDTGLIKNSNTAALIDKPLSIHLEEVLQTPIHIENDANCFAIAEARLGSAVDFDVVFGIIMGTGVGGGLVINKTLHKGRNLLAGEWGHNTLYQNGNMCYCGREGCVETYLSGPALEARWQSLDGTKLTVPAILENLDTTNGKLWKNELVDNFGRALANVINILDPDVLVLGGGLSNIDILYTLGRDAVYNNTFSDVTTPIIRNTLGDSAGVYGAALLDY